MFEVFGGFELERFEGYGLGPEGVEWGSSRGDRRVRVREGWYGEVSKRSMDSNGPKGLNRSKG